MSPKQTELKKTPETTPHVRRVSEVNSKQNLDEIVVIEKKEVKTEESVKRRDVEKVQCKEKGFSIQRAWCCLRNRRTS